MKLLTTLQVAAHHGVPVRAVTEHARKYGIEPAESFQVGAATVHRWHRRDLSRLKPRPRGRPKTGGRA